MKYEPVFKLPYSNVFITDLFLPAYKEFEPIATIKNGKWEFFLSKEVLDKLARIGFELALNENSYKFFEEKYKIFSEKTSQLMNIDLTSLSNEKFIEFLKDFKRFVNEFFETYRETEFFYFAKIETEISKFIEGKYRFEDVLSNKVDLTSWPEDKKKLADYLISMQHLKLNYRKLVNNLALGQNSLLSIILGQVVVRTGREDSTSMTFEEVERLLNREEISNVFERHVYSFITLSEDKLKIISGVDAYRKIRELESELPKDEVIGTPACKGFTKGKVRIIPFSINPEEHLYKFQEGEVLVSDTTGPEMVVIMQKAAAIVTDEGGMMSHAAVVSREFGIPCIVGTKYATEVFKDGDLVEVNANNGIVKRI